MYQFKSQNLMQVRVSLFIPKYEKSAITADISVLKPGGIASNFLMKIFMRVDNGKEIIN